MQINYKYMLYGVEKDKKQKSKNRKEKKKNKTRETSHWEALGGHFASDGREGAHASGALCWPSFLPARMMGLGHADVTAVVFFGEVIFHFVHHRCTNFMKLKSRNPPKKKNIRIQHVSRLSEIPISHLYQHQHTHKKIIINK